MQNDRDFMKGTLLYVNSSVIINSFCTVFHTLLYLFNCFIFFTFILLISVSLFNYLHTLRTLKAHTGIKYLKTDMKAVLLLKRRGSLRCREIIVSSANILELININGG